MESKSLTRQKVDRDIARKLQPDRRSLHEKLVLSCRMLGAEGHWHGGLAGQISARGEQPGTYWTLRFGIGADEATPGDLILVDDDLQPLDGDSLPNPATRFHLWVYRHRPDVQSIVHTHPAGVTALSMVGQPLAVAHMDATPFFDNCAYLGDWPGLPIADDEGAIISEALGSRKALLLAHHGLLTAGASIEEAAVLAIWLEQAAQAQLKAAAIGTIRPVRPELARESRDFLLKPEITGLTFQYFARRVLRQDPHCLAAAPATPSHA
jgi:L-fuculose-phosphate aldolase